MTRVRLKFPETVLFAMELLVRIDDLNYGAHLAHDRLVSMLHEVRANFFRHFSLEEWDTDGLPLMVLDLEVSYRSQAFFGQELRVEVAAGDRGSRVCDLLYRVTNLESGAVVALAKTGVGFFDRETQRLASVPASFCQILRGAQCQPSTD